jgi:glucose-6-phosphate 1-dehydrogenase
MIDTNANEHLGCAVDCELSNIKKVHGTQYNSLHEGYAVLLEEVEETKQELFNVQNELTELWTCVKQDDNGGAREALRRLNRHAYFMLQEAAQVCAVTAKFRGTENEW